ncbi:MAG: LysR family transcriptional regulator [Rhodobacteraceae bacterium PARR1]|nr:MAG: LysR family transcriptional regulator [Rhodobacteraceae bacterium PARR1]
MQKQDFNDYLWLLALARERSFTRAAAQLGVAQSTLSHTIKRLEARMGLRLVARTTRSVALTDEGARLVAALAPRIEAIDADINALMAAKDMPSGTVRITLSDHALTTVVWPKLGPVLKQYPDIGIELFSDNGLRNIVEGGFDAGVRLGDSLEKDMIALRVSPDWRLVAVASPGYFRDRSKPVVPRDLLGHNCINTRHSMTSGLYAWEFAKNGEEVRVRVDGQLTLNASLPTIAAALDGHGIAYMPEDMVSGHIAAGRLQQVLDDWCPSFPGYFLFYPSRRQNSAAFTVVANALRHR